jgi:hypothetical protein
MIFDSFLAAADRTGRLTDPWATDVSGTAAPSNSETSDWVLIVSSDAADESILRLLFVDLI